MTAPTPYYDKDGITIYCGDCRDVLPALEPDSVDAIVTDPPYGLEFMGKDWDKLGTSAWRTGAGMSDCGLGDRPTKWVSFGSGDNANATCGNCGGRMRGKKRCECKSPDWRVKGKPLGERNAKAEQGRAMQEWHYQWAVEALRVAKPGAHLLAFGGTRTHHRLMVAIEDAGWEIRDCLMWLYGTGFPKSLDVSKAIDKAARGVPHGGSDPTSPNHGKYKGGCSESNVKGQGFGAGPGQFMSEQGIKDERELVAAAKQWDGWGTALKPAHEEIILARKPFPPNTERDIMVENLIRLESQLWSLLPASAAERSFKLSPAELKEASAFAQWSAEVSRSTRVALLEVTDMSQYVLALTLCLNTVMSWRHTLGGSSALTSTFITKTKSSTTTDWTTLKSCSSVLTPQSIIQAAIYQPGSWCNAFPAAMILNAADMSIRGTQELSALASATSSGRISYRDVGEREFSPAWEPIILARKPLDGTVAANVQQHGTGALNVDGCRVNAKGDNLGGGAEKETQSDKPEGWDRPWRSNKDAQAAHAKRIRENVQKAETLGRFPANLIHDGSDEVLAGFPDTGKSTGGNSGTRGNEVYGKYGESQMGVDPGFGDSGSAARFFYTAKASKSDRGHGNNHPTVKPTDLMRYLVRLVCPIGGTVLDLFNGSGATTYAARKEHCRTIGIEQEASYCEIAVNRLKQGVLNFTE